MTDHYCLEFIKVTALLTDKTSMITSCINTYQLGHIMYNDEKLISLPVTIYSEISDQGTYFSRPVTEKFSQNSGNPNVPDKVIQELAAIFTEMDGKYSYAYIDSTNSGFCALCDFLKVNGGGLESIYHLTTADAAQFLNFCQEAFPKGWKNRYITVRSRLRAHVEVFWPEFSFDSIATEGFSVSAIAVMREKLKAELDRIRNKIGRLENDLKIGKVIEIDMSAINVRAGDNPELLTATRADIIKTIRHHLQSFPLDRLTKSDRRRRGTNPGLWLLQIISMKSQLSPVFRKLHQFFSGVEDLYEYYFPTSYDATCIILYVALLTGWNRQVVESVGSDELNLRFKRNHLMEAWCEDHVIIKGKKIRGQPKGNPKIFSHISDKHDKYGLFNVLNDFYSLTKTIRFGSRHFEDRCIIMAVVIGGFNISCFGPGAKIPTFAQLCSEGKRQVSNVEKFFTKHEIYDDADSDNPIIRIKSITWRQTRTSYETVLEHMGLPLYVRQMLLGHSSIDTTMFPYASDKHSTKIQMDMLGNVISSVHADYRCAKLFQGAFMTPENDPRRSVRRNQKVVSFARSDWKDNIIMLCANARKPTWPGHEHFVQDAEECDSLANCLFCAQCLIGRETLPYLSQWDMDIQQYFEEEGDWDIDLKWLELQQAIKEVFEIWALEKNADDIMWAKAAAMCSDFMRVPLDIWHIGNGVYSE